MNPVSCISPLRRGSSARLGGTARLVSCLGLFLAACSHRPGHASPDGSMQVEVSDGSVRLGIGFDDCPVLIVSASPSTTRVGGHIAVRATASDPDPTDRLTYRWTAGAGSFANATASDTTYTCPASDGAGRQNIAVAVSDGKCTVSRSAAVSCLAEADTGRLSDAGGTGAGGVAGPNVGGGSAGGTGGAAGAGGSGGAAVGCVGDPSLCEGDLCNQCTYGVQAGHSDLCSATASSCFNCSHDTDGCAELASDADRTKCYQVYTCMRDSGCVDNDGVTRCWCGSADTAACASGGAVANGPCVAQMFAGAGTSQQSVVFGRLSDPHFPVGRAVNLAVCRYNFCGKVIDSEHPACPLW